MNYQKVIILIAVTILIIILSYVGYNLHKKIYNVTYPPITNKCPYGWEISANDVCVDTTCPNPPCEHMSTENMTVCEKQEWAKKHGNLYWYGITDIDLKGCDRII